MAADRLQHAGHGDFLYRRGSVYYFRRSVPPALREAFGKREIVASLGTAKLTEARHLLNDHVRAFDMKAAKAGGRSDPTPPRPIAATAPDRNEMNAAVRAWLAETLGRRRPIRSITRDDCRKLRNDVLLKLPKNCSQRFPGMAVADAILAAERAGAEPLGSKTRGLMAEHLISFFDWALKEDLVVENPARAITIPSSSGNSIGWPGRSSS